MGLWFTFIDNNVRHDKLVTKLVGRMTYGSFPVTGGRLPLIIIPMLKYLFILNSNEHEIQTRHKYQDSQKQEKPRAQNC